MNHGIASGIMALELELVYFSRPLPELDAVRIQVAARSGLAVGLRLQDDDHGRMHFACLPELSVELIRKSPPHAHDDDAATRSIDQRAAIAVRGAADSERTLFLHTCCALEELGGESDQPLSADKVVCWLQPISEAELCRRVGKYRQTGMLVWLALPLHLFLLPLWLVLLPLWLMLLLLTELSFWWRKGSRKVVSDITCPPG